MGSEIVTVPLVMSIVLALALQLVDIAESSSEKVVHYAGQMDSAIDCAFRGIDISYCAPDLDDTSFKEELEETLEIIEQLKELNETINMTEAY